MPLKVEKRRYKDGSRSSTYYMRGTISGKEIFRSTFKTKLVEANKVADTLTREYEETAEVQKVEGNTKLLIEAAVYYFKAGGERRYLEPLMETLGMHLLTEVDQVFLDSKGRELMPSVVNATLVRQFYTPLIALHRFSAIRGWCPAKIFTKPKIKEPATDWAELDWFHTFWQHCDADMFRITIFLPYTGCRISECLALEWEDVRLKGKSAYIRKTKNGEPRTVNLPDVLVEALSGVPEVLRTGKVFPWKNYSSVNRRIKSTVKKIKEEHGITIKYLTTHKIGSHTYGTWMLRETDLGIKGLVDTRRWKDLRSAMRYAHTSTSSANKKSDNLPTINMCKIRAGEAK